MTRRRKGLTDPRGATVNLGDDGRGSELISRADSYGTELLGWVEKGSGDAPKSRQIVDPFENLYTYGGAIIPPLDPYRMLQLVENSAIHSACITAKAADAVGRGWIWEPQSKDADPERVKDLDRMLEFITPGMSFSDLLRQAVWEKDAIGWSGWEVARAGEHDVYTGHEPVAALFPMPSHTIRATQDENVWVQIKNVQIRYFKVFGVKEPYDALTGKPINAKMFQRYLRGDKVQFEPAREIIVFKRYSPRSPYYGIPGWIGALPSIAELQAIREFNISFFQSGGTVDRIIHVTADNDETAATLALKIHDTVRDAAGRGHVTVVTHGNTQSQVDVKPMNGPQGPIGGRDAQFIKRREDLVKEVLIAHNMPPYRIGWAEIGALGGSAAKEMLRSYKVGTVEPDQTLLEDQLAHTLFGPKGMDVEDFKWKLQTLDWDETELNLSIASSGVQLGILTRNEGRDLIGKERFEDPAMDKITSSSQVMPITSTEEAKALAHLIGEWKNALNAVLRAPPPPPPLPAATQMTPGMAPPGAAAPGPEAVPMAPTPPTTPVALARSEPNAEEAAQKAEVP